MFKIAIGVSLLSPVSTTIPSPEILQSKLSEYEDNEKLEINYISNTKKYPTITWKEEKVINYDLDWNIEYNLKANWSHSNSSIFGSVGGTRIKYAIPKLKTNLGNDIILPSMPQHKSIPFEAKGKSSWGVNNSGSNTSSLDKNQGFSLKQYSSPREYIKYIGFNLDFEKFGTTSKYNGKASVKNVSLSLRGGDETSYDYVWDDHYSRGQGGYVKTPKPFTKISNYLNVEKEIHFDNSYEGSTHTNYKYADLEKNNPYFRRKYLGKSVKYNRVLSIDEIFIKKHEFHEWYNGGYSGDISKAYDIFLNKYLKSNGKNIDVSDKSTNLYHIPRDSFAFYPEDYNIGFKIGRKMSNYNYEYQDVKYKINVTDF